MITVEPKKRHGNRKPVIPAYTRPNSVRVFNAAMRLVTAYEKGEPEFMEAHKKFRAEIDRFDGQVDRMIDVIHTLDNMID